MFRRAWKVTTPLGVVVKGRCMHACMWCTRKTTVILPDVTLLSIFWYKYVACYRTYSYMYVCKSLFAKTPSLPLSACIELAVPSCGETSTNAIIGEFRTTESLIKPLFHLLYSSNVPLTQCVDERVAIAWVGVEHSPNFLFTIIWDQKL